MNVWFLTTVIIIIFFLITMVVVDWKLRKQKTLINELRNMLINNRPDKEKEKNCRDSHEPQ